MRSYFLSLHKIVLLIFCGWELTFYGYFHTSLSRAFCENNASCAAKLDAKFQGDFFDFDCAKMLEGSDRELSIGLNLGLNVCHFQQDLIRNPFSARALIYRVRINNFRGRWTFDKNLHLSSIVINQKTL